MQDPLQGIINRPIPLLSGALFASPSWPSQQLPAFVLPCVARSCYGCFQLAWTGMQAGAAFQLSTVLPYPVSKEQLVQGGSLLADPAPYADHECLTSYFGGVQKSRRECNGQDGHRLLLQLEHLYWHWAGNCAFCGSISGAIAHRA